MQQDEEIKLQHCVSRSLDLRANGANTGLVTQLLRHAGKQSRIETDPATPAGRLRHTGRALHLHGALVGLSAQWAMIGINSRTGGVNNLHDRAPAR
jgi:hypothetical protein